jgi:hypothetical protein
MSRVTVTSENGQILRHAASVIDLAGTVPPLTPSHRSRTQPGVTIILKERATRPKDLTCRNCTPRLEVVGAFLEITHQPRCRTWRDMLSRMGAR